MCLRWIGQVTIPEGIAVLGEMPVTLVFWVTILLVYLSENLAAPDSVRRAREAQSLSAALFLMSTGVPLRNSKENSNKCDYLAFVVQSDRSD